MIRYFHNNRGITLPEVSITLVLLSIVSIAIYSFLFNGLHSYEKVRTETAFRDEADIVMTSFINRLYPVKEAEITKKKFTPAEGNLHSKNGNQTQILMIALKTGKLSLTVRH